MRVIAAVSALLLTAPAVLAQPSLCNPCVDSPSTTGPRRPDLLMSPGSAATVTLTAEEMRSLGIISVAEMIAQLPSNMQGIDEALLTAARGVMPRFMNMDQVEAALVRGLWRRDRAAVVVSLDRQNESTVLVFVRQANGDYATADASGMVAAIGFGLLGRPAETYERYEVDALSWGPVGGDGSSVLQLQLRAWRDDLLHSVDGEILVRADGSISQP